MMNNDFMIFPGFRIHQHDPVLRGFHFVLPKMQREANSGSKDESRD